MWRGIVGAALCLGLAACGAEEAAKQAADDVRETIDPVAEAADRTVAADGARLLGDVDLVLPDGTSVPMELTGAISFEDARSAVSFDLPDRVRGVLPRDLEKARRQMGTPWSSVTDGDVTYTSLGLIREKGAAEGIEWLRVDMSELDEQLGTDLGGVNAISEGNPAEMLRFLRVAGDARKTGTKWMQGVETTRWEASADLRDYPDVVAPDERAAARRTVELLDRAWDGDLAMDVTVWIDDQGLIRRERMQMPLTAGDGTEMTMDLRMDLLDVGKPQEIELPDEDEVMDITDEAADQLDGASGDES